MTLQRRAERQVRVGRVLFALALVFALFTTLTEPQAAQTTVTVHHLDCGRIEVADMDAFADDGAYKGVADRLVTSCYLIRHPKGDLLWDAGVGDQFSGPEGTTYMPGYVAHVPLTLESQLRSLGTDLGSINFLAFSHEHIDHTGNANALTRATWILNRREHEWTIARDGEYGRLPPLLAAAARHNVKTIEGEYDLFGDGTVRIIPAPGHTPGHQVLFVARTGGNPVILAGDLWHSYESARNDRVPRFNTSRSETLASMAQVRALAERTGAAIVIGHAPEDFHPIDAPVRAPTL